MTPESAISMLDRQLAAHGMDIRLVRNTLGPGGTQIPVEVTVRAFVRGYSPNELVAGLTQNDSNVIISPTEINASGWPGPGLENAPPQQDRRIPIKGDRLFIDRRPRNVEMGYPLFLAGVLVRIEMRVLG